MIPRTIVLLLAAALLVGCATTNIQPVTSGAYEQLPEEKRINRACGGQRSDL